MPTAQATSILKKHKEAPVAFGRSNAGRLIQVWASAGGETWTLVTRTPQGLVCMLAMGEGWRQKGEEQ